MREREAFLNTTENNSNNLAEEKINGNGSIEEIILDELGFDSLEEAVFTKDRPAIDSRQIPTSAAKEIIAVDCLKTNISNKLKLLGYCFWHNQLDQEFGNYDLVKRLLPEGLIRIDDSRDDVLNSDELIELYEKAELVGELTSQIINPSQNYIKRLKIGSGLVLKLIDFNLEREEILGLKNKINKTISKRISPKYHEFDNEKLNDVEFLGGLGFYAKEISWMSNISRAKVGTYMSALYLDGRLRPQQEKIKSNEEFKRFALKVEKMRAGNSEMPLSNKQIANILGVSKDKVSSAVKVLILLGRIKPLDMSKSLKRFHENPNDEKKVSLALKEFRLKNPKGYITYRKLREMVGSNISIKKVSFYYQKISQKEIVPPTLQHLSKKAEKILIEAQASNPDGVINIAALSREHGIPRTTFIRQLNKLRQKGMAPMTRLDVRHKAYKIVLDHLGLGVNAYFNIRELSRKHNIGIEALTSAVEDISTKYNLPLKRSDYYRVKREEFLEILRTSVQEDSALPVDLNEISCDLGINSNLLRKWYRSFLQQENMPPIRRKVFNSEKKEFLFILREIKSRYQFIPLRLEDYAIQLGVKPSTVRSWYWEFSELEELPPLKNSFYRNKKSQALELLREYMRNNEGLVVNLSDIARQLSVKPIIVHKWYRSFLKQEAMPPTRLSNTGIIFRG